jgi:outer membrane receptor protein involved in Fe transport
MLAFVPKMIKYLRFIPMHVWRLPAAFCCVCALASACIWTPEARGQAVRVEGAVLDASGAAVSGADVKLTCHAFRETHRSDASGNFRFESVPGTTGALTISATGFVPKEVPWSVAAEGTVHVQIVLAVSGVSERVTVTATRTETRLDDTAVSGVVLNASDLHNTPALTLDDSLRQVPGFSLFRRSGSRTANPGTQGVSLRGLGSTAASRALVLDDGLALGEPFGDWNYWGRIPQASLATVEVIRGAASALYGSDALSGVIQFRSRPVERAGISIDTSYGNQQTPDFSFWAGGQRAGWDSELAAAVFHTDGFILVPQPQRGSVDTPAGSEYQTVDLTVGRRLAEQARVFARGQFYTETRQNGTPLQTNDATMGEGILGAEAALGNLGSFSIRGDFQGETLHQNFSAIAAGRMSETLTDHQRVPAQRLGGSVQWNRAVGEHQTLVAGFEMKEVRGLSDDQLVTARPPAETRSGGRQRTEGVFLEDILRLRDDWIFTASVRFDHWSNFDAGSTSTPLTTSGAPQITVFPSLAQNAWNPRLAIIHRLSSNISLTASGYRAFRAPTLNELYRTFRVGNVLTLNNPNLRAERLTGAEGGVKMTALARRLNMQAVFFWDQIGDPVANVTLNTQPNLITRQKQNLGRTQSVGLDLDGAAHLSRSLELSGGYELSVATVQSFPANPGLVGLWVPQVPRHQFTLQGIYSRPSGFLFSLQGRYGGGQFEDDQNLLFMDPYFVLSVLASRSVGKGFEIYGAVENLLNQRYTVGLTPVPTVGPPLLARVGIRFNAHAK